MLFYLEFNGRDWVIIVFNWDWLVFDFFIFFVCWCISISVCGCILCEGGVGRLSIGGFVVWVFMG